MGIGHFRVHLFYFSSAFYVPLPSYKRVIAKKHYPLSIPASAIQQRNMDMSHGSSQRMSPDSSMMPMSSMPMVFFTSTTTPLFSSRWSPTSTGSYAGTCIFLIALAVVFRGLLAGKTSWSDDGMKKRSINNMLLFET